MSDETTFCFYVILYEGRVIHLSFEPEKHNKALSYLKKHFVALNFEALQKKFTKKSLREFLAGNTNHLPPPGNQPFVEKGTSFQRRVWHLIATIPYGETRTYSDLARALGKSSMARAVGRACNTNPLALYIPCHRVTGKNSLGGFAGGTELKKRLLELEATS